MPRVFDNIDQTLLPALKQTLAVSERADFCVGYFNLRGWKSLDSLVDQWSGNDGECCRLLVGMQALPQKELEEAFNVIHSDDGIDNQTAIQKKRELAREFRDQLMLGAPGSSNLTFAGLQSQGELNIDVLDHDACQKLKKWFEDRWTDRWCIDISKELADIIDESWASPADRLPYHIYLKIAFHLFDHDKFVSSRGHRQFNADSNGLRSPSRLDEGIFTEINLSANGLRDVIRNLLKIYELSSERLQIFLRDDRDAVPRGLDVDGGSP